MWENITMAPPNFNKNTAVLIFWLPGNFLIWSNARKVWNFKGIVSRDWGGLQTILLDRYEVFIISATGYFFFRRRFHKGSLKMAAWAVLHFNITCQMTTTVPGTQTVLRTAKKSCGEFSPEVPGKLILQICILYSVSCEMYRIDKNLLVFYS